MSLVSLFYEDDTDRNPRASPNPASERGNDDLVSIKVGIGPLNTFISNTSTSMGVLSSQTSSAIVVSCGCNKKSWSF